VLEFEKIKKDKNRLLALTGLTLGEFDKLLPYFARKYGEVYEGPTLPNGQPRKRAVGGGRGGGMKSAEQKLLFILVHIKTYPLQVVLGSMFDMGQSAANQWIHRLLPVLRDALDHMGMLPQREGKGFWVSESGRGEGKDYVIDGTDRKRERPKNADKQRAHYSGKKKAHSDKNIVISSKRTNRIGFPVETYAGKTHDKKMAEEAAIRYPRKAILHKDTGFQGYEPQVAETRQPKKSRAAKK
jgi:Helix-turn-helix of DDE superfamily endonuclease/DDE superfamily endonuclease